MLAELIANYYTENYVQSSLLEKIKETKPEEYSIIQKSSFFGIQILVLERDFIK